MKVLHLLKTSHGAKWGFLQISEVGKLGIENYVAIPPGGKWYGEYEKCGCKVYPCQLSFPITRPWHIYRTISEMRSLVSHVKPDIIHSYFVNTTITMRLALGKKHQIPRIFQVPGPLHLEHVTTRKFELATSGPRDFWIGMCRKTEYLLKSFGISANRVFTCYGAMDLSEFRDVPSGKLRAELSFGSDTPLVGTVAFMYAPKWYLGATRGVKGHEDLIDAAALCLKEVPEIRFVFVGGAWSGAESYAKRVMKYGREKCGDKAVFLGNREDAHTLCRDLNVFVCPSLSESVAGSVVEALMLDKPVVATDVGGMSELIVPGETGWLVPPHNPKVMAEAILEALRNPDKALAMARKGREKAMRMFDFKITSREIVKIYEKIRFSESHFRNDM